MIEPKTKFMLLLLLLSGCLGVAYAEEKNTQGTTDPREFFIKQSHNERNKYQFNEFEYIISGSAAFLIGNIGYVYSDSPVLKLTYTGIQTIGIINIGQGIYKINSPSAQNSMAHLLADESTPNISKKEVAQQLLEVFAREKRAKRLSVFYSSSALAVQYGLNAMVYESPKKLKNIYIFLSGVNSIIALYSGIYKSDDEAYFFGPGFDIRPFASLDQQGSPLGGAILSVSF